MKRSEPEGTPGVRDPWIRDVRRRLDQVERELWWVRVNITILTALGVVLLLWVVAIRYHW